MSYSMFIDDTGYPSEKPPIGDEWVICRDLWSVKEEIVDRGMPSMISFDYDLGEDKHTGIGIAEYLCMLDMGERDRPDYERIADCMFPNDFRFNVQRVKNPIGAENIQRFMENYLKSIGVVE